MLGRIHRYYNDLKQAFTNLYVINPFVMDVIKKNSSADQKIEFSESIDIKFRNNKKVKLKKKK